jgi:hypothetical protein
MGSRIQAKIFEKPCRHNKAFDLGDQGVPVAVISVSQESVIWLSLENSSYTTPYRTESLQVQDSIPNCKPCMFVLAFSIIAKGRQKVFYFPDSE